jgi:hypothetical protein
MSDNKSPTSDVTATPALSRRKMLGFTAGGLAAATVATVAVASPAIAGTSAAVSRAGMPRTPAPRPGDQRRPWMPVISAARRP